MIATGIIIVIYGVVLLELLFKDNLIMVRYLHFSYLALFILSLLVMMTLTARALVNKNHNKLNLKKTKALWLKTLWFLPAFLFISFQYLSPFFSGNINNSVDNKTNKAKKNTQTFKFLSYSVNSRNKDYEKVAELLKENPADVICLQEIPYSRYKLFTSAMKMQGLNYHHVYSRKKALMILSTQTITPNKTMPYLQATVELNGQPVKIWNIHSPKSLAEKNYQNFYFDKLIDDIKADTTDHQLVCGDFNSTPHNDIISKFHNTFQAAYKYSSTPFSFTYPTPKGIIPSPIPFLKIDYLLFTPNFRINHYQRIEKYANSDHYPILATAKLQEKL